MSIRGGSARSRHKALDTKNEHTDYVSEVVRRYFRERHAAQVEEDVQRWLLDPRHAGRKLQSIEAEWEALETGSAARPDRAFDAVRARIGQRATKTVHRFRRAAMRVAAVVVPALAIAAGVWVYLARQNQHTAWIDFVVPYGQTAILDLPDGSQLAVNSGSTVSYPEKFAERSVRLSGEAYFDVAPDAARPFVVETGNLTVRVTGTEFNVQAVSGINTETVSVSEGGVEVLTAGGSTHDLYAGDRLTLDKVHGNVTLDRFEPSDQAWSGGGLSFSDNTCVEIFAKIGRHFEIPFHYAGTCTNNQRYTLKIKQNDTVDQVMTILDKLIDGFTYAMRDDGIHIEYE